MTPHDLPVLDAVSTGDGAAPLPFPRAPQGWGAVCASASLRRGEVRRVTLIGRPAVVFRGLDGRAGVLAAHCPHMGAHLGGGRVTAEGLSCPLHGWTFDAAGTCRRGAEGRAMCAAKMAFAYPVEERYGVVFAFNGPAPTHPLLDLPAGTRTRLGKPVTVDAPWEVVSANGFDVQHLGTVHGRAMREAPDFGTDGDSVFYLNYVSRVTGTRLADRVMKRVTDDRIRVRTRCYAGTIFLAETHLPRRVSRLVISLAPTPDGRGTVVTPLFTAEGSGPAARLTLAVASWLFQAFLAPDQEALRDMAFRPPRPSDADAAFVAYLDFLRGQPQFTGR